MAPVQRKVLEWPAIDSSRLILDPELLDAVLRVHRELELKGQAHVLLRSAVSWCGATCGFAVGPGEEGPHWGALAGSVALDDPRLAALENLDPLRIKTRVSSGTQFVGFGPFSEVASRWPVEPPAHLLVLPVLGSEHSWGSALLLLFDAEPSEPTVLRLRTLLEAVRPAVENALQVHSMQDLVIKDDTADCYNRRHFETCLPDELSRAGRFHAPLSLIFLDMDNLKEVNNRFGHAMGSRSLLEVSQRIRAKIRRFDKLFRFGGDEFCIVLPETAWHGALEVAERVRDAIANKPFLTKALQDSNGCRMTASLGIASFPLHARTQREMIEQADRAMQRIKKGTKNSIGIAEIVGHDDES